MRSCRCPPIYWLPTPETSYERARKEPKVARTDHSAALCAVRRHTFAGTFVRSYFNNSRCRIARCRASSSELCRMRIFTSNEARCPAERDVWGSTCWHVSSGLLQTLPVVRAKLATTQTLSLDSVAMKGSLTARDLL